MTVKLLTEQHLEFLSIKGGCTGSSESTFIKMPHCWKPHVVAHKLNFIFKSVSQITLRLLSLITGLRYAGISQPFM